ncbi:hypothetical protein [Streptomyces sp. TLI_185]|uniref:hypothetical protein n=1 Tax=Streptomyces sp. TLI_185 TaxID=2485151 RepID=UPI000FB261F4|nr:hypothetical protein [Streptomyces sp. TLI_185]RPF33804.1 hypothetical protein EDD92_3731 [Streptomyces sp. TLI_185]
MTYNLLTVEPLGLNAVTAVLAQCLHVREQDVDVADEDTDQQLRNWDALVLCEKKTVLGDVSTSLDIYVQDSVQPQPDERELASAFAQAAGAVVLFPAESVPVSAYWLTTEDGRITRARLYDSDDEEPVYTIDTVEAPVGRLPHVTVARVPEVVRELKIATPVKDVFAAQLHRTYPEETSTAGTPFWEARSCQGAWEKLVPLEVPPQVAELVPDALALNSSCRGDGFARSISSVLDVSVAEESLSVLGCVVDPIALKTRFKHLERRSREVFGSPVLSEGPMRCPCQTRQFCRGEEGQPCNGLALGSLVSRLGASKGTLSTRAVSGSRMADRLTAVEQGHQPRIGPRLTRFDRRTADP